MSDPQAIQAAALAAVDRLIEIARAATNSGFVAAVAESGQRMACEDDARFVVSNLPDRVLIGLEGRRHILQRRGPVLCRQCPESRQHYVDALFASINWPSEDWRDAAAGLPLEDTEHD